MVKNRVIKKEIQTRRGKKTIFILQKRYLLFFWKDVKTFRSLTEVIGLTLEVIKRRSK